MDVMFNCENCIKCDVCKYSDFEEVVIDTHDYLQYAPFVIKCEAFLDQAKAAGKVKPAAAPVRKTKICKTCETEFEPDPPQALYCPACRDKKPKEKEPESEGGVKMVILIKKRSPCALRTVLDAATSSTLRTAV
jgi:hypothetical protein